LETNFKFKYFFEFEAKFENILDGYSGIQVGPTEEKPEVKKSYDICPHISRDEVLLDQQRDGVVVF
jgi:hypothetical protein